VLFWWSRWCDTMGLMWPCGACFTFGCLYLYRHTCQYEQGTVTMQTKLRGLGSAVIPRYYNLYFVATTIT
jgi:hypothetical protein